ncbi:MAG TPA: hypothetical protein DCL75_00430 [Ktedonobacter sp.]|nr:hypothetical protein [Ktedonobacter sp.]HAT43859.1 hypothetical protein [Ktedonobacter sp.]HCF86685.1 hypothetical protein [Ktedonobacter sp.]
MQKYTLFQNLPMLTNKEPFIDYVDDLPDLLKQDNGKYYHHQITSSMASNPRKYRSMYIGTER